MSTDHHHDAIASLCALRFFGTNNSQVPTFNVMDNFYAQLTPMKFPTAKEAASFCRQLAREYGFTVKQETSSNKNVYVYCSREGISESVKIGRETKRKRSSLRCDCKWRVVLFRNEQGNQWEFRKSVNPQHSEHNHDLTSPEHIPEPWPPNVLQRIADLANSGLSTGDIRSAMQLEFPNLLWDERRFYNRLAEERKKLKIRDTEQRVIDTIALAARLASLACSNREYTDKVHSVLHKAFEDICRCAKIDPSSVFNDNLSTYGDMTVITPSTSSTADIICTYPAGIITVKNIPGQKGRPSKKNLQQLQPNKPIPQSQCQLDQIDNTMSQNILTPPNEHSPQLTQQQINMSLPLQTQTESSPQSNYQNEPLSSQLQQQNDLHFRNELSFPRLQNKDLMLSQLNAQNVLISPHIQNSSTLTPQTQPRMQIPSQSYFHSQEPVTREGMTGLGQFPREPGVDIRIDKFHNMTELETSQKFEMPTTIDNNIDMKFNASSSIVDTSPLVPTIRSQNTIGFNNAPRLENTNTYENITNFASINSRIDTPTPYNQTEVNRIFTSGIQPYNSPTVNRIFTSGIRVPDRMSICQPGYTYNPYYSNRI